MIIITVTFISNKLLPLVVVVVIVIIVIAIAFVSFTIGAT